jgi:tetratricopeptide (TPR) repeat protein
MKRERMAARGIVLALAMFLCWQVKPAAAQDAQQGQPSYTIPEYNAFQACRAETNAQTKVKCLDDFVAKFPKSTLMKYIDQLYWSTYNELKNYAKVTEFADKYIAESDAKADVAARVQAFYTRCAVFEFAYNPKAPDSADQLNKAKTVCQQGLDTLNTLPKPDNMNDQQFAEQKKPVAALFYNTIGFAELQLKDYTNASAAFKSALTNAPTDGVAEYRLGVAYLQENPPQFLDGFWSLARAIALKAPGDAQIKDYLRKQLVRYQQSGCDNLIDSQMNELLQLAAGAPDRPASYSIPSAADLDKVRQGLNILSVITDLSAGGDKAKTTWLAVCGSDFPEVVGKVIDVTAGTDNVELHVYTGATSEEMEKATTANMDVKIVGQPEASRLQKDDGVRFSGTLTGYDPSPFMLHWDKGKVNPEDIPPEKKEGQTRKPHKVAKPSSE